MRRTLRHLQLCAQYRVVQCRRYLADSAAHAVHSLAVQIRPRHGITVFRRKRSDYFISRKLFSRIQYSAVDVLRSAGNILTPVSAGCRITGSKAPQQILHILELFRAAFGFRNLCCQFHGTAFFPAPIQITHDRLDRSVYIQNQPFFSGYKLEFTVGTG